MPELPWLEPGCPICGIELRSLAATQLCGDCLIDPPPFSRSIILFSYDFPISSLILKLKFQQQLAYAKPLGMLLSQRVAKIYQQQNLQLPDCIIPVPLHPSRLRSRGYNQALEIARPLEKELNIPIDYQNVQRTIATAPQTLLSGHERQINVAKVFKINKKFHNDHVAIIDDVVTTFSTVIGLATALQKQGTRQIDVWCLARA